MSALYVGLSIPQRISSLGFLPHTFLWGFQSAIWHFLLHYTVTPQRGHYFLPRSTGTHAEYASQFTAYFTGSF